MLADGKLIERSLRYAVTYLEEGVFFLESTVSNLGVLDENDKAAIAKDRRDIERMKTYYKKRFKRELETI